MIFCLLYITLWLNATKAADAAWYDLELLKNLSLYEQVDKTVASRGLKIFENQFWYLTEELAPFSLFSSKVPDAENKK